MCHFFKLCKHNFRRNLILCEMSSKYNYWKSTEALDFTPLVSVVGRHRLCGGIHSSVSSLQQVSLHHADYLRQNLNVTMAVCGEYQSSLPPAYMCLLFCVLQPWKQREYSGFFPSWWLCALVRCVWCLPSAGHLRRCVPTPTLAPSSWQDRHSTPPPCCYSPWPLQVTAPAKHLFPWATRHVFMFPLVNI